MPPEPEVVRTPRTGVPIQHRIAIVIPAGLHRRQWPAGIAAAPRALAEPRLEAWAQGVLGDPADDPDRAGQRANAGRLPVCARSTCCIDADGDSVGTSTLAARLRRRLADLRRRYLAARVRVGAGGDASGDRRAAHGALDVADVGRAVTEGETGRAPDAAEMLARADAATTRLDAVVGSPRRSRAWP